MFQITKNISTYLLLFSLFSANSFAAPSMALGYSPKYKDDFTHFDYVNADAPQGGTLTLSSFGTYETLNPFLLKSISADGLGTLMFETLLEKSLDEPFSAYGLLAEDIALAEDQLSVTFTLRKEARFNDGSEVTAKDIKFSFDTIISDQAHPQFKLYFSGI
jgi:microcin C transport system substrate-binding protein